MWRTEIGDRYAPNLHGLETMGDSDRSACCNAAGNESPVAWDRLVSIWSGFWFCFWAITYPVVVDMILIGRTKNSLVVGGDWGGIAESWIGNRRWIGEDMPQMGKEWRAQFSRGQCCRADCKPLLLYTTRLYNSRSSKQSGHLVVNVGYKYIYWSCHQSIGLGSDHIFNALRYRFRYLPALPATQQY